MISSIFPTSPSGCLNNIPTAAASDGSEDSSTSASGCDNAASKSVHTLSITTSAVSALFSSIANNSLATWCCRVDTAAASSAVVVGVVKLRGNCSKQAKLTLQSLGWHSVEQQQGQHVIQQFKKINQLVSVAVLYKHNEAQNMLLSCLDIRYGPHSAAECTWQT